jgi:hypothetical protein
MGLFAQQLWNIPHDQQLHNLDLGVNLGIARTISTLTLACLLQFIRWLNCQRFLIESRKSKKGI